MASRPPGFSLLGSGVFTTKDLARRSGNQRIGKSWAKTPPNQNPKSEARNPKQSAALKCETKKITLNLERS
jgi:hypothetical protein